MYAGKGKFQSHPAAFTDIYTAMVFVLTNTRHQYKKINGSSCGKDKQFMALDTNAVFQPGHTLCRGDDLVGHHVQEYGHLQF